jgi:methionine salvage enolase-phosphatase E1
LGLLVGGYYDVTLGLKAELITFQKVQRNRG